MQANRFYSVPYDALQRPDIRRLGLLQGDKFAAFGRWHAVLGMLYDNGGLIELDNLGRALLAEELALADEELDTFLGHCLTAGLIDREAYEMRGTLTNKGVCSELMRRQELHDAAVRAGQASGKARRKD